MSCRSPIKCILCGWLHWQGTTGTCDRCKRVFMKFGLIMTEAEAIAHNKELNKDESGRTVKERFSEFRKG